MIVLSACTRKEEDLHNYGGLLISDNIFKIINQPLFKNAVESSIIFENNQLNYFIEFGMNGEVSVGNNSKNMQLSMSKARLHYILKEGNNYYNFVNRDGSIFLYKSADLLNWQILNEAQPVLTKGNGIYKSIWNVGVTIDNSGVWHMLVECSETTNGEAGLGYSYAKMAGTKINFDSHKSEKHVIRLAGNPWIGNIAGRGLMAVYGKLNGAVEKDRIWEIGAAKLNGSTWVESSKFRISAPKIHIADPHLVDTNSGAVMTLSYDQYSVYLLNSNLNLTGLYDYL